MDRFTLEHRVRAGISLLCTSLTEHQNCSIFGKTEDGKMSRHLDIPTPSMNTGTQANASVRELPNLIKKKESWPKSVVLA
jgi:hypothetical protein